MSNRPLNTGDWIVVAGLLLLLAGAILMVFVDQLGGGAPAGKGNPAMMSGTSASNSLLTSQGKESLRMVPVVGTVAVNEGVTTAGPGDKSGMILLQQAPQMRFNGQVQQVSEQPQSDGQLHLWVQDAQGKELRVSVGPGWFLSYLGCPLRHDAVVEGSGFTFEKSGQLPLVYAKWIRIDNRTCQLRNDEGFALWSNKLR